MSPTIH